LMGLVWGAWFAMSWCSNLVIYHLGCSVLNGVYARVVRTLQESLRSTARCAACGVVKDLHCGFSRTQRRHRRAGLRRCLHCAASAHGPLFMFSPVVVRTPTCAFVLNDCEYISCTRVLVHLWRVAGMPYAGPHAALVCAFLGPSLCADQREDVPWAVPVRELCSGPAAVFEKFLDMPWGRRYGRPSLGDRELIHSAILRYARWVLHNEWALRMKLERTLQRRDALRQDLAAFGQRLGDTIGPHD
jgi:hypothetical protein